MKKEFKKPEIKFYEFEVENIVCLSGVKNKLFENGFNIGSTSAEDIK